MNRLKPMRLAMILVIVLMASPSWADEAYQAKVIGVSDGDTIKVLHEGAQVMIRRYGIYTPENRQPSGNRAKQYTVDRVFGKTVKVVSMDTTRYGRRWNGGPRAVE